MDRVSLHLLLIVVVLRLLHPHLIFLHILLVYHLLEHLLFHIIYSNLLPVLLCFFVLCTCSVLPSLLSTCPVPAIIVTIAAIERRHSSSSTFNCFIS